MYETIILSVYPFAVDSVNAPDPDNGDDPADQASFVDFVVC